MTEEPIPESDKPVEPEQADRDEEPSSKRLPRKRYDGDGGLPRSIRSDDSNLQGINRNTKLIARAMKEGWKIPDKYRDALVKRQVRIAVKSRDDNASTKAFNALATAELRERSIVVQEKELELKSDLAGAIADGILDGNPSEAAIAAGHKRLLDSVAAMQAGTTGTVPTGQALDSPRDIAPDSRSVAG